MFGFCRPTSKRDFNKCHFAGRRRLTWEESDIYCQKIVGSCSMYHENCITYILYRKITGSRNERRRSYTDEKRSQSRSRNIHTKTKNILITEKRSLIMLNVAIENTTIPALTQNVRLRLVSLRADFFWSVSNTGGSHLRHLQDFREKVKIRERKKRCPIKQEV